MPVEKSLDIKLKRIHENPNCNEFILADAKDPDLSAGIAAPGKSPEYYGQEGKFRSLEEFREQIRLLVRQGHIDVMLMSPHTNGILTIEERLFDNSHVTPAARANDTTDIHVIRGGVYPRRPSLPMRTTTIDHIQCGKYTCEAQDRVLGANLGLYSVTFTNDTERDRHTLQEFKAFRLEAEAKGFRYFLEVFDPNVPGVVDPKLLGGFINDHICRALGGVPSAGRPLFLKIVFHGPKSMEELVHYDPHLVVGILGGAAGTTYDAFKLLEEAKKYGAKVSLFGRKINNAENQLAFVEFLHLITSGKISAEEAVRAYHGVLQGLGIKPYRTLDKDMEIQTSVLEYLLPPGTKRQVSLGTAYSAGQSASRVGAAESGHATKTSSAGHLPSSDNFPKLPDGSIDFAKMTPAQKIAYQKSRWDKVFG
jgi:hypothetical protein